MESILQEIANKMTFVPAWITYIGIFVPIFVSVAVLVAQILQNKTNKNLQKNIYNHQVELKCFDSVLEIYSTFSASIDVLSNNVDNIKDTLANEEYRIDWHNRLIDVERQLCRKYDFALMLLGRENELVKMLEKKVEKYCSLVAVILENSQDNSSEKTDQIDTILEESKNYMDCMSYDEFDKYFLDYLNINRFTES